MSLRKSRHYLFQDKGNIDENHIEIITSTKASRLSGIFRKDIIYGSFFLPQNVTYYSNIKNIK